MIVLRIVMALLLAAAVVVATVAAGEWALHGMVGVHGRALAGTSLAGTPFAAKLGLVVVWSVAAFAGACMALRVGRAGAWLAWVPVALQIAGEIGDFVSFHHPSWMIALGVLGPVMAGYAALAVVRVPRLA